MREFGSLIAATVLVSVSVTGQAATTQNEFDAYRQQQRQGAQQVKSEFKAYKEKQDGEFADFLKSQWREFETYQGKVRIKGPKPRQVPVAPAVPVQPSAPEPVAPAPVPDVQVKPHP